jgi:multidrug efflux pump subunit AcrB
VIRDQHPEHNGSGNGRPPGDQQPSGAYKEFFLTSLALRERTSVLVLFGIIAIMGIVAYVSIPKESSPDLPIPYIAVQTVYAGAAPGDVETLVTRVIEEDLNTIPEIKDLTSTSVEGFSSIMAEFETDVDIDEAMRKVREKVDLAKPDLPDDAEEPNVLEFNFADFPIVQVNVSGNYSPVRLKEVAEDLQDRLEQLPAVLRADLSGGLEREVQVDIDLAKLKFHDLALDDVIDAIRGENVNVPGGSIDVGSVKYLVRVDGEFTDPSEVAAVVVATRGGQPIFVRDIGTVMFGFKERDSYARLDNKPVVTLDVVKRSGENVIETIDAVRAIIEEARPSFPPSTDIKLTSDQSKDIRKMVSSLENNIVAGLVLIVSVLLFFLGVRNSFFVGISIPTSMLLSFIVLQAMGITMNMVVLFSLILALGMLVDNAIVVVENTYRFMEQGWERAVAARKAVGEIAIPIIAATATTLAAFFPLLLWPGIVGEFMGFLPKTVIVTLSSSLFVALVIVPVLCAMFMQLEGHKPKPMTRPARYTLAALAAMTLMLVAVANWLTAVLLAGSAVALSFLYRRVLDGWARAFQHRILPAIIATYERTLRWSLDHRLKVLGGTAGVFVATVVLFGIFNSGVEFFPEDIPPSMVLVEVDAPVGTNAHFTNQLVTRIEQHLPEYGDLLDDAETTVSTVGGSGGSIFSGGPSGSNAARVTVSLIDFEKRKHDTFELMRHLERSIGADIAGADVNVTKPDNGPPTGQPVNIEIVGPESTVLDSLASELMNLLRRSPVGTKLQGLENDMDRARPELRVRVDREKAALYGLSTSEVGMAIRGAIQGIEAGKFRTADDEYDITVRLALAYRDELTALRELNVVADGRQVPLVSLASWEVDEGYGAVQRKNLDRVATVSAEAAAGLNSNAVLAEVQQTLAPWVQELPAGYFVRYTGQSEDQAEAQAFLSKAFLIAVMLIGLILITQFNSLVKPIIILTSVLMSTIGVLIGLMVFRMPFGIIMTGVGVISLAGIVVNNAIILVDYIDVLRRRDGLRVREALVKAGKTRFRPVILTATTTALGLVPLAVGLNFDFFGLYGSLSPDFYWGGEQAAWWGPMAIAVIVGILIATFLTLVLVPVMYSLVDDLEKLFKRHYTHQPEAAILAPADNMAVTETELVPVA